MQQASIILVCTRSTLLLDYAEPPRVYGGNRNTHMSGIRNRILLGGAVIACVTSAAGAQATNATFIIESSNDVSPSSSSTTISVYAVWDQPVPPGRWGSYTLIAANYDLVAEETAFTDASLASSPIRGTPGVLMGNRVNAAAVQQLHAPALGVWSNWDNPILLAQYTWTTTYFAQRTVDLTTENTSTFSVAPTYGGVSIDLVEQGRFAPGTGRIIVVPAVPTVALLGATTCLAMARRRRVRSCGGPKAPCPLGLLVETAPPATRR